MGDNFAVKRRNLGGSLPALFLAATLAIAGRLPLQAQKFNAPVLAVTEGGSLGITLVNPTLTEANVILTARNYSGGIIQKSGVLNPATLTLPASSQKALLGTEVFGAGISGETGWVELSPSTPAIKGFFLVFDSKLSYIDGAELPSKPASRLIFPKVSAAAPSPTVLTLVNTSGQAVNGTVSLYENSGRLAGSWSLSMPAHSGFSGPLTALVPSGTGFKGYVVVDSGAESAPGPESLIGIMTYRNSSDIAVIRAFPQSSQLRTGYLPHLVSEGGYVTTLTLVNYHSEPATLQITAQGLHVDGDSRTPSPVSVERTLPPYGRLEEDAGQMFGLSGNAFITGYIRFETTSSTPGVIAFLDYGSTDGVVLCAVEAQSEGYSHFFFSQVAETPDYYTGMVLLNTNSDPAIVTIDNFNPEGSLQDSAIVNLNPGERQASLLSEVFHRNMSQSGGYIRVTATRPVSAFELFGSRNSFTFLASVPAQGVRLNPQASGRVVNASNGADVVSDDDSTSLIIPPGALTSDAAIKVGPINVANLPAPGAGLQAISAVEASASGTQLQIPVRLTFPLNADFDPGTQIPLLTFDPDSGAYTDSGFVAIVDNSNRTASAAVTHFAQFVASVSGSNLLSIAGVGPTAVVPGDTVTVTGSGFDTNAEHDFVTFAGPSNTSIHAVLQSATTTTIRATAPAGVVTGPVVVRVGSQTSTGVMVVVTPNRRPGAISITPTRLAASTGPVDLEVVGTSFAPGSVVNFDGAPAPTTFVNQTLLVLTLSGSQLSPGIHTTQVFNPSPGGGASNTVDLWVSTNDSEAPTRQTPVVNLTLPAAANLAGAATDDGLPAISPLTTLWSKVSGTGTVTFENVNASNTTASFTRAGTYVLRLTATNGALSATRDTTIVVSPCGPTVSGTVTISATVNAGAQVAGVQFKFDGANSGAEITTAPYSIRWNTTTTSTGCHTLTAIARDTAGKEGTSPPLLVNVDNP